MPWPPVAPGGSLPRPLPGPAAPPRPAPLPHWRGPPDQLRILVVDDDADIRTSLQQALTAHLAADVLAVGDAFVARRVLEASRCDVVLLDQMLPGLEGSELLAWMQSKKLAARTIVMTALPDDALSGSAVLLGGAAAVLRKPLQLQAVLAAVRSLLPPRGPAPRGRR